MRDNEEESDCEGDIEFENEIDGVSESEGVMEEDREGDTEADGVMESEGEKEGEEEGGTQGAQYPLPVGGESHHVGNGQ